MANYCCTIRTNYFHVKDEAEFRSLMEQVYGSEDAVEVWEKRDDEGNTTFGFGCYGGIAGIRDTDDDDLEETAFDRFLEKLQQCVAEDDAVIILEAGNEKMRYVVGTALILTSKACGYLDIAELAEKRAAELLAIPSWKTKLTY
mgnify:FL=1